MIFFASFLGKEFHSGHRQNKVWKQSFVSEYLNLSGARSSSEFGKQKSLIFSKLCRLHTGNGMGFINLWAKFLWVHWGARHQPWLSLSSVTRANTSASLERRVLRRRFGTLSIGNFGKQWCLSMTHFDSEMQICSLLSHNVVFVLLILREDKKSKLSVIVFLRCFPSLC